MGHISTYSDLFSLAVLVAGVYLFKSASEVVANLGDKIPPCKLYGNVDLTEKKSEEICAKSQAEQPQKQTSPPVPEVVCEDVFR